MFALTGTKRNTKSILSDYLLNYSKKKETDKYNIIKSLTKENKKDFFEKIKKLSKENIMTVGTEGDYLQNLDKNYYFEDDLTIFGVYGDHEYNFIKAFNNKDKYNRISNFFQLWNPHGSNPNPEKTEFKINFNNYYFFTKFYYKKIKDQKTINGYYKYDGFDKINEFNKKGFKNGNIILDMDRFLYAFKSISFQNRNEVSDNYNKYHKGEGNIIDSFLFKIPYFYQLLFFTYYIKGIDYYMAKIFMELNKNKANKEKILPKIIKEGNKNEIEEIDVDEHSSNLLNEIQKENKEKIKNEILQNAQLIMSENIKNLLNKKDKDEISQKLIEIDEKSNDYLNALENNKYISSNEIKKEIEKIAKTIAEKYINNQPIKENEKNILKTNIKNIKTFQDNEVLIKSSLCFKALTIRDDKIENESNIVLYDASGKGSQIFKLINNNDGTVSFINGIYAIDVKEAVVDNETVIQIYKRNDTKAQKFILEDKGDNFVSIHSALDDSYCIDVSGAKTHNFNKIQLWKDNGTGAQKFQIFPKIIFDYIKK